MNNAAKHHGEDGGPAIAMLLIVFVAIGLIFLPTACGLSLSVGSAFGTLGPF